MTPSLLYYEPTVSSLEDPDYAFDEARTFSVFPVSSLYDDVVVNPIEEKHQQFFLRCLGEAKGYTFVEVEQSPDLLLTIHMDSSFKESYIPPSTRTVFNWVPGTTTRSTGTTSGVIGGAGTYSGRSTTTTTTPGHISSRDVTTPGYTVGHFYPGVLIEALEGDAFETVWYGTGVGTSDNHDARVSGQAVAYALFGEFPSCSDPWWATIDSDGFLGFEIGILTNDGNAYFPTIVEVFPRSPATAVRVPGPRRTPGLKEYDMITAVDGTQTERMSRVEAEQLLAGLPGTTVTLEIARLDHVFSVELTRVSKTEYEESAGRRGRMR